VRDRLAVIRTACWCTCWAAVERASIDRRTWLLAAAAQFDLKVSSGHGSKCVGHSAAHGQHHCDIGCGLSSARRTLYVSSIHRRLCLRSLASTASWRRLHRTSACSMRAGCHHFRQLHHPKVRGSSSSSCTSRLHGTEHRWLYNTQQQALTSLFSYLQPGYQQRSQL